MNRKAAVSIVWIMISMFAFIAIIILTMRGYVAIMSNNGGQVDSEYLQKYADIAAHNRTLVESKDGIIQTVFVAIPQAVASVIGTVFNIGLSTLQNIAISSQESLSIIELINATFGELSMVFWFVTSAIGLYIAVRAIQEFRGASVGV